MLVSEKYVNPFGLSERNLRHVHYFGVYYRSFGPHPGFASLVRFKGCLEESSCGLSKGFRVIEGYFS